MIKNLTIILACGFMAGCAIKEDCFDSTRLANATLGEIVYQTNLAHDGNFINDETFGKIDDATDQAEIALDTARSMCVAGDDIKPQMSRVQDGITESLKLYRENNKKDPNNE